MAPRWSRVVGDMTEPLVSVIVPTKNSAPFLGSCLRSINRQTYREVEVIVVDNGSSDATKDIALRYTTKVYDHGPERSAQVNYGARMASGAFVYKVDSDFVLDPEVIAQCVARASEGFDAVIVHNSPDASVSWIARVRKFEVDMYKYDLTHSSARFVRKAVFDAVGGFDEKITAGEDYDFQNRLNKAGIATGFVEAEALHLGEPTRLAKHLRKYYDYGRDFGSYRTANRPEARSQLRFLRSVYLRNWRRFLEQPALGIAFMGYNVLKFAAGSLGFAVAAGERRIRAFNRGAFADQIRQLYRNG